MTLNTELLFNKNPAAGGYTIERSLRFSSADSAFLSRTPASAGNRKTWTWAGWVKRCTANASNHDRWFAVSGTTTDTCFFIGFGDTDDKLYVQFGYITNYKLITNAVFRDPSAWYHVVLAVDVAQSTASDKVKVYVSGIEQTSFSTDQRSSITNTDWGINTSGLQHEIGKSFTSYLNGYLADVHFIDGQALDPTSFGEFDTNGVWQPIAYSGSYGTNGFHLDFADNSSAAALGDDTSGNNNDWTVNNIATGSNPIYSNNLTTNGATTGWFGGTPAGAFDGNTSSTFAQGALGGDVTFTPAAAIPVTTSLKIWADSGSGFGVGVGPYQISYNGTQIYNSSMWSSPYTISAAPGTSLSSLVIDQSGSGEAMRLFAIEVDGVILVNGAGAGEDSLRDSPTNGNTANDTGLGGEVPGNYCTLNPLANGLNLTNGNLDFDIGARVDWKTTTGTYYLSSGKWYWEVTTATQNTSAANIAYGIRTISSTSSFTNELGYNDSNYAYFASGGKRVGNTASIASYGASYTTGDVIGVALDMDAGTLTMYKNGSSQGTLATGLTGSWTPAFGVYTGGTQVGTSSFSVNFGQRSWAYAAPAGFKALCTANLPEPTIADGSTAMDVKLYTGNGSTQTISGLNLSPDAVWVKRRDSTQYHRLQDIVRGTTSVLYPNGADPQDTSTGDVTAFNSDGFSVGSFINAASASYVAWTWDAGSSTVTNTQGSISSQVRANASAGFSVATWSGSGSGSVSVGHGLGVAPQFFIVKDRSNARNWLVYHVGMGATRGMQLNLTTAQSGADAGYWNNTAPTSTVATIGTYGNESANYVGYFWTPVSGYSSFGSYTGNGSTDGPFVYTGHRSRWLMTKRTDTSSQWSIWDTTRNTYNAAGTNLWADSSEVEATSTSYEADFLSNGFKMRNTHAARNASGGTYIYMSFAEHPFQTARAR